MCAQGVDSVKVTELRSREDALFARLHPRSAETAQRADRVMPNGVPMAWFVTSYDHPPLWVAEGRGSRFRDIDGNEYVDFNIADMSMFTGYAPELVVKAVANRMAAGSQFLLPIEDAIWVAEELRRRYGMPQWQFTLSASGANVEAIRVARANTGRDKILFFSGKYHGHFDEALLELDNGELVTEEAGLPSNVGENVVMVHFNDLEGLGSALERHEIAVVVTEPVLTNWVGLVLPDPDFHAQLRAMTRDTGTLLTLDETHTHVVGIGGLTSLWSLEPDIITIGKSIGGGMPFGAYGMTEEVAEPLRRPTKPDSVLPGVATGGTLFANPLSIAAARATLGEILVPEAYQRTQALGTLLANGIEATITRAGLPWIANRFWPRSGYTFGPTMPRNAAEAWKVLDAPLRDLMRIYLANRGVWEAIVGAGPTCSVATEANDVDDYLSAFDALIGEITA